MMRSASSVLAVRTNRSAKQFALGDRGGIFTVLIPAPVRTASKAVVNWPARSRTRNRKLAARSSRSISRLRACWVVQAPVGWRVARGYARSGGRLPYGEKHVDPFQGDGAVDVEEVHGQHGRRLRPQEPTPGGVRGPQRCRRYPPPLEDPTDRRCADAVADFD